MKELIKIIDNDGIKAVSARELHSFLQINERFSRWFERMSNYGLVTGTDYTPYINVHPQNKQEIKDYALTIDGAKIISMLQRNKIGNDARRYFIEAEKELRNTKEVLTPAERLLVNAQILVAQEQKLKDHDNRIEALEIKTTTRPEYYTIAGYARLKGISVNKTNATALGRAAAKACKQKGLEIDSTSDARYGKVNMYPIEVLNEVFESHNTMKQIVK